MESLSKYFFHLTTPFSFVHIDQKSNNEVRSFYLSLSNVGFFVIKRRRADDHFIEDDPDGPPVAGLSVALLHQDFRGDVIRRSDQRMSHAASQLFSASPFERFHAVGNVRTGAASVLQIFHVDGIHRVLTVVMVA